MKTVLVLRHAKSSRENPDLDDHERPLNARGRRDAPRMGQLVLRRHLVPDRILCSTAVRAQTTAHVVAGECGYDGEVTASDDLYLAGPSEYIRQLSQLAENCRIVMVVGHNPGLEDLVALSMPTAALAEIRATVETWAGIEEVRDGELANLWRPKELD